MTELRAGTGISEGAMSRFVMQTGLAVLSRMDWREIARLLGVASVHGEQDTAERLLADLKAIFGEV